MFTLTPAPPLLVQQIPIILVPGWRSGSGDVGGWICPLWTPNPPHQASTTVTNHSSSTVTTNVPTVMSVSPTVMTTTGITTPTVTPQSPTVTPLWFLSSQNGFSMVSLFAFLSFSARSHANSSPSGLRKLSLQRPCSRFNSSDTHPRSRLPNQCTNPPSLTIPTHPLQTPPIPLPLHQVLTTWIPSAFFNGTQAVSPHPVVPNSVPFSPPIGMIWCFSKRLISPALGTLKSQATMSSELIVPSPAGIKPLLETRMVVSFHSDQLGPVLSNGLPSHPYPLRPGLRLSLHQNQLPKATRLLFLNVYSLHQNHSTRFLTSHLFPWTSPELSWHVYFQWYQYSSLHLGHSRRSWQCWQFPIQLDIILPARYL